MRTGVQVDYANVQANRAGYHVDIHSSIYTDKQRLSAGVAMASKWRYGHTDISDVVSMPPVHRFMFKHWHGFARGGLGAGTAYLHATGGMDQDNQALLHSIAGILKAWGLPFIIGGDWQMSPQELIDSGWPDLMGAKVVHSSTSTYFSGKHERQLDYFLASHPIAGALMACYNREEASVAKHIPVVLQLDGDFNSRRIMRMKRPMKLPAHPPRGRSLPPPTWDGFQELAVKTKDQEGLNSLYDNFRKKMVPELLHKLQADDSHMPEDLFQEPKFMEVTAACPLR